MWCHSVHWQYLALFSTCFSIFFFWHSDWLIVLDCLRRCCRCGRWMSSYKSNRAGSWCSLWGFRRCGLFAFVHICLHWNNWLHCHVAFTWCQNSCWHLMLPYHGSVFGLLLTQAQQSPSGTMQQSMKSQACFFSFVCVVCFYFWMLLFQAQLDVRIKPQSILYAFCCNVLVRMDIAWYCRSVAWMVRGW